jgi:hypothetical protein
MEMKPMDEIALRLGWIAITAARLEHTVGIIVASRTGGGDRVADVMGRRWSDVYGEAKKLYRDLATQAGQGGAAAFDGFYRLLIRANDAMTKRHHVLHALWTANADVVELDGASSGFRRHGVTEERHWTFEVLLALATELNDLHQLALGEVARIAQEQGFAPPAV